jgi:endonuclease V-like protein UPF0215 family
VIGTVYAGLRLEGVLRTKVRRDGRNATSAIAAMIARSQFARHTRLVLLQGIALAGFNVVDIHELARLTASAVLVVARRKPKMAAIRAALLGRVRGGARKWRLVERAGSMEPAADLWVQRAGLSLEEATSLIQKLAVVGRIPEPLRAAHLIAGGVATGASRGRA